MTSFVGGKQRISPYIFEAIRDIEDELIDNGIIKKYLDYYEIFSGMASVALLFAEEQLEKDTGRKIIINDINKDVEAFWKGMKEGIEPPKFVTEKQYYNLKEEKKPSFLKTYAGYNYSFGSNFYTGYMGRYMNDKKFKERGYNKYNKIIDIQDNLMDYITVSKSKDYRHFDYLTNKLIYLDPPYYNSLGSLNSKYLDNFDTDEFWEFATYLSKKNIVFVSETYIPKKYKRDWNVVWSKKITRTIKKKDNKSETEKLFLHKKWYDKL